MNNSSNAKRKLSWATASLIIAFLAISIAVFAVWAATRESLEAYFNINYVMNDNIAVEVKASYQIENYSSKEIGKITFNLDDKNNSGNLSVANPIELSTSTAENPTSHQYVDFSYSFENLTDENAVKVSATWNSFASDIVQMNVYVDGVKVTDFATCFLAEGIVVQPLETKVIVLRFEVATNAADARMTSDESTGLKWLLEYAE